VLCERCVQTSHFFTVVADALKNEAGHPKVPGPFSAVGSYLPLISINAMFQRSIFGPAYVSLIVTLVPAPATGVVVRCTQYVSPLVGLNWFTMV